MVKPFIELNSDAMAEVDSKVGTLHLAIEFDMTHKNKEVAEYHYCHPKLYFALLLSINSKGVLLRAF